MKRRIIAILLVLATVLGMFPTALAASSEDEALGEVGIYHNGQKVSYCPLTDVYGSRRTHITTMWTRTAHPGRSPRTA